MPKFHAKGAHPICVLKKLKEWGKTIHDKEALERAIQECISEGKINPVKKLLREVGAI